MLLHVAGFIIRICDDARSSECQSTLQLREIALKGNNGLFVVKRGNAEGKQNVLLLFQFYLFKSREVTP